MLKSESKLHRQKHTHTQCVPYDSAQKKAKLSSSFQDAYLDGKTIEKNKVFP